MSSFLLTSHPIDPKFNPLWVVAAITIAGILIGIGRWSQKVQSRKGDIGDLTSAVNNLTSAVNGSMSDVRESLKEILQRLDPRPTFRGSPIRLTDMGEEIADQIDVGDWAWDKAQELAIEVLSFAAEYEFHAFADDYVRNKFIPSDEFRRKMEACAYQNGVSADQVKDVLVVVLRDILLAQSAKPLEAEE